MATETYIPRFRNAHCLLTNLLDSPLGMLVSLYFKREKKCVETLVAEASAGGTEAMFSTRNCHWFLEGGPIQSGN